MGISFSRTSTRESEVESRVHGESETMEGNSNVDTIEDTEEFHETSEGVHDSRNKEDEMIEFQKQLEIKREQRREVLARHREEKENLKKALEVERQARIAVIQENTMLKNMLHQHNIVIPDVFDNTTDKEDIAIMIIEMQEELEKIKENNKRLRRDLAESNLSLLSANSDIADLHYQNVESTKQINALREVITVSKTMINIREQQLLELKEKLNEIERSLADRESSLLSTDLRQEYERQLKNIRTLRGLYEERARLAEVTRLNLQGEVEEQKRINGVEVTKNKELTAKVEELEEKVNMFLESIENKNEQIKTSQQETRDIQSEMSTVNKLFSEVLLGYKGKQNWDQLVQRLEQNHGLLIHMVEQDDGTESSSALPKLLLELVNQIDERDTKNESGQDYQTQINEEIHDIPNEANDVKENNSETQSASAEEIARNLPKVWKVLTELLSHQNSSESSSVEKITTCYKTVETASGPVLVPSVSQTYIRLKDLIVEKLALIKEVNKMKQLNGHLESRLGEQERRLCLVTSELSKTWHVVGRLRRHHHQLHTHEKILKYELQQKRKLLNELKEELEYCREKWQKAREKNSQTERDWKKLKAEFNSRKVKANNSSFNHSGESGYSDERPSDDSSDSNDEGSTNGNPLKSKTKIKTLSDNILDSSADINLAAEREDPISDMLDVAELPLDSHELDRLEGASGYTETDVSDISHSNLKSDRNCEETEDEVGEISIEVSDDHILVTDMLVPNTSENKLEVNSNFCIAGAENIIEHVDNEIICGNYDTIVTQEATPTASVENIPLNDNKADDDLKKQSILEKEHSSILQGPESTIQPEQVSDILERQTDQPSSSRETRNTNNTDENLGEYGQPFSFPSIDAKQILENIKRQHERLEKKNLRLKTLEEGCNEVLNNINGTINVSKQIDEKLDKLCDKNQNYRERQIENNASYSGNVDENKINEDNSKDSVIIDSEDLEQDLDITENVNVPSTSQSDIGHEARFAARDLRLQRLEEQTKSLVNKVNNTASKRVKLNYKLEELHNIYGSENSRASTPFDENDDEETNEDN